MPPGADRDAVQRALASLGDRSEEIVALTRELVELESPTDHVAGVTAVAERLATALEPRGARATLSPVPGHGPLLEARASFGTGAHVLLLGHADTLWPVGTTRRWPFEEHADGRLTGPGVGDMKSCLAVAVAVLDELAREHPDGLGAVTLLVVPDEETGSAESRASIERVARTADACLTLEAARPGGGIVTSRGAVGAMTIRATGHARHVTDPGPAASALRPLAELVAAIEALDGASVGILRAGSARQIVPAEGELHVDLRAATTEAGETLAERVRALAAGRARAGVAVTASGGITRPAWSRDAGAAALFAAASEIGRGLGLELAEVAERGGSDASFAGALGVPTLDGLGPPCEGSCSEAETVRVDDLAPWGALLYGLVAAVPALAPPGPASG